MGEHRVIRWRIMKDVPLREHKHHFFLLSLSMKKKSCNCPINQKESPTKRQNSTRRQRDFCLFLYCAVSVCVCDIFFIEGNGELSPVCWKSQSASDHSAELQYAAGAAYRKEHSTLCACVCAGGWGGVGELTVWTCSLLAVYLLVWMARLIFWSLGVFSAVH